MSSKVSFTSTMTNDHEKEAAENNPNPEAEMEIIEQVKDETNSADETTAPAQPDSTPVENDGNTDAANPVVEEESGSGRQLVSVAARFVSAALACIRLKT